MVGTKGYVSWTTEKSLGRNGSGGSSRTYEFTPGFPITSTISSLVSVGVGRLITRGGSRLSKSFLFQKNPDVTGNTIGAPRNLPLIDFHLY